MPQTPRRIPGRRTASARVRARHHRQSAALGALATLLHAGCASTSVTPGQPEATPTADAPTSSQQAATSTSTSTAPARPADLDLTGKDPCTIIEPATLTGLNYRVPGDAQKIGPTKNLCAFRFPRGTYGTGLFFDTGSGAELPSRAPVGTVLEPIEVSGYPAYTVQDQQLGGCTVKVDVHDGQTLSTSSDGPQSEPVAPLCDRATQLAILAIAGLTSL